jgi:hypothetical protein
MQQATAMHMVIRHWKWGCATAGHLRTGKVTAAEPAGLVLLFVTVADQKSDSG